MLNILSFFLSFFESEKQVSVLHVFLKKGNSLLIKRKETLFGFFIVRSNKKKKYLRERKRERFNMI